jgi:hypothetical protein
VDDKDRRKIGRKPLRPVTRLKGAAGLPRPGSEPPCCSFCGKGRDEVRVLLAGPGVQICDECVAECGKAISDKPAKRD